MFNLKEFNNPLKIYTLKYDSKIKLIKDLLENLI